MDNYSLGTYLTDNNVANIVGFAIGPASAEKFPEDPNGVYFVLTSSDVSQASFPHWETTVPGTVTGFFPTAIAVLVFRSKWYS